MRKQIQDERTIHEALKQNSIGFTILYFGLLLDLLYRQFILQEPISRYWDIALLFFGVTFYLAVRRISSGLLATKLNAKGFILSSVSAAIVFLIVNYWLLDNTNPLQLAVSGVIFFAGFYAVNVLMQYLSCKKNQDMLDDD